MISKKNILTIFLNSIFVIAFNILFFVNGGSESTTAIWICYGFLHFSYLMVVLAPIFSLRKNEEALSKTTVYAICVAYFLVELVMSVVVFFFKIEKTNFVISEQVIATAIFFFVFLINLLVDDSIEKKQIQHNSENSFLKRISAQLKYIETLVEENSAKAKINALYNLAHSSPTKSTPALADLEKEIENNISRMEESVSNKNAEEILSITKKVENLLNKRNLIMKNIA